MRLHKLAKVVLKLPEERRELASSDDEASGNFLRLRFCLERILRVLLLLQRHERLSREIGGRERSEEWKDGSLSSHPSGAAHGFPLREKHKSHGRQ